MENEAGTLWAGVSFSGRARLDRFFGATSFKNRVIIVGFVTLEPDLLRRVCTRNSDGISSSALYEHGTLL